MLELSLGSKCNGTRGGCCAGQCIAFLIKFAWYPGCLKQAGTHQITGWLTAMVLSPNLPIVSLAMLGEIMWKLV